MKKRLKIKNNADLIKLKEYGFNFRYDEDTGEIDRFESVRYPHDNTATLGDKCAIRFCKKELGIFKKEKCYILDEDFPKQCDAVLDIEIIYNLIVNDLVEIINRG